MQSVDFLQNYNCKLFLDHFGSVQVDDPERFFIGNTLTALLKGKHLGTVIVVASRGFLFKHISDVLAYIDIGQPAHYLAELIRRNAEREGTTVTPDTRLDHVIFSYTERNIETHQFLLQEWWQTKSLTQSNQ